MLQNHPSNCLPKLSFSANKSGNLWDTYLSYFTSSMTTLWCRGIFIWHQLTKYFLYCIPGKHIQCVMFHNSLKVIHIFGNSINLKIAQLAMLGHEMQKLRQTMHPSLLCVHTRRIWGKFHKHAVKEITTRYPVIAKICFPCVHKVGHKSTRVV